MLCTEVVGRLDDPAFSGMDVDYVELDWHEAFKKLHRKESAGGRDVGIRLGDWVLQKGLSSGDVLGVDESGERPVAVAVRLLPTKCLVVDVAPDHPFQLAKVGWEVGNTHTPLFFGDGPYQLCCTYTEPIERLLSGLHAVEVHVEGRALDPARRVSNATHHHHHGDEGHGHGAHAHGDEGHEHGHARVDEGHGHAHAHGDGEAHGDEGHGHAHDSDAHAHHHGA